MSETLSPELELLFSRASAPIVPEGYTRPLPVTSSIDELLSAIDRMQNSPLTQLSPEGTPLPFVPDAATIDADRRAAELAFRFGGPANQFNDVNPGGTWGASEIIGKSREGNELEEWFARFGNGKPGETYEEYKERRRAERAGLVGETETPQLPVADEEKGDSELVEETPEAEGTPKIEKTLLKALENVDWTRLKNITLTTTRLAIPLIAGMTLGNLLSPEQAQQIASTMTAIGLGGITSYALIGGAELMVSQHPRAAKLARVLAVGRVASQLVAETGALMGIGTGVGLIAHVEAMPHVTTTPAAPGAHSTETPMPTPTATPHPTEVPQGTTGTSGATTGSSGAETGGGSPPVDVTAAMKANQAAEAAHQASLDAAQTTHAVLGKDLAGGTVWGNELAFAKQLGVTHTQPVANFLKDTAKLLAQPQPFTKIGPASTEYVINRDVAAWAAKQLDTLYRMDPSAMTPWQKSLWEIGRGLRPVDWTDLQKVTDAYAQVNH